MRRNATSEIIDFVFGGIKAIDCFKSIQKSKQMGTRGLDLYSRSGTQNSFRSSSSQHFKQSSKPGLGHIPLKLLWNNFLCFLLSYGGHIKVVLWSIHDYFCLIKLPSNTMATPDTMSHTCLSPPLLFTVHWDVGQYAKRHIHDFFEHVQSL